MRPRVDIVHESDVDAFETKPLEAFFKRAHHPVIGIVEPNSLVRRVDVDPALLPAQLAGLAEPADLGRGQESAASPEGATQPHFGEPVAIKGCSVEIADTRLPRRVDRLDRLLFRDRAMHIS